MTSETDDLRLAADFPPAGYDDWRKLVDGVLKGAPFEKLISKTADGLQIDPIYPRARGAAPVVGRARRRRGRSCSGSTIPMPPLANAQALHDLENGANGLTLVFAGANGAHGFGLDPSAEAIEKVLDGVFIDAGISGSSFRSVRSRGWPRFISPNSSSVAGSIPPPAISVSASIRSAPARCRAASPAVCHGTRSRRCFGGESSGLAAMGFKGPFAAADGRVIHDAGGSEAQELAFVLAAGVAYLRAFESAGMTLEDAQGMIYARLSADAEQFLTMAKFRALRLLWARVEQASGLAPKPLFIAADTAWRMLTQRDAYVNMLRATMATFSAGLGGADSINVLPHTLALGLPDAFARRVARNTQLVLLEESNLAKVSDPAAGSGGIETLTQQLCEAAWSLFQEIEKAGGAFAALEQGLIQRKVAATRAVREANIARRKEVLTGATEFPNLHEAQVAVLDAKPVALPPYGEAEDQVRAAAADAARPRRSRRLRDRSDARS